MDAPSQEIRTLCRSSSYLRRRGHRLRRRPLAVLASALFAAVLMLPAPAQAQAADVHLDGAEPWTGSDCAGDVPIVVGSDAKAQSDIYSAVTLAGVVGTDCVILAGPRDAAMPASQRARLAAAADGGYVLGGTSAVPDSKVAERELTRISGADRWATAQLVGNEARSLAGGTEPEPANKPDAEPVSPGDVRAPGVYLDGAEPWIASDCAGDVPIVVGSDAKAQSDIYSAVTLAGILGTDCVILAGPRDGSMPASQRARLDAAEAGGYVLGGTAAVPTAKIAGRDMTRFGGITRWATAQLVGRRASGDTTTGTSTNDETTGNVQESAQPLWTLSGTVSHGWADPVTDESGTGASCRLQTGRANTDSVEGLSGDDDSLDIRDPGMAEPAVTTMNGDVVGAVVEIVDGPDAGRQATTDDRGCYVLEGLEQAQFAIHVRAEGFAPVGGVVDLTSNRVLDFAISDELPAPRPPSPAAFPDTDPAWLRALAADYPHVYQVANVRVFSDISPTFSKEHAEHLKRVWDFFDALYVRNFGDRMDAYYTSDPTIYLKASRCGATTVYTEARTVTRCIFDYARWFIIPFEIPDFGTQLHEIGHDFLWAVWPQAWVGSVPSLWFVEGTAMYWEGGVFTDDGSLRVSPLPWCTGGFDEADRQGDLIPLAELLLLGDAFYPDPRATYPQSCMLFNYLEQHEAGVLYALINRINSGQIASNDQLITALLDLTGKTVIELEKAYESYARKIDSEDPAIG